MDFKDFSVKILRDIIKKYELHYIKDFEGYSKMGKREILNKIKKHLFIEGDLIKQKKETFETKKPRTTAQKKLDMKIDDLKAFYKKQLEGKDLLIKPLEANLSSNIEIKKRKTRKDKGIKKGKTGKRKEKTEDDVINEGVAFGEEVGKKTDEKMLKMSDEEMQKKLMEMITQQLGAQHEAVKAMKKNMETNKKKGAGKRDIILADYKKVQNSSDKEKSMLLFVKKYPELGLDENKIIGLFDRKPWFTIDKLVFDTIMGMRGGALGVLDVLDQSGKAADIADKIPFGGKIAEFLRGLQTGVDLVRATGSTLKNTTEQFAPGASQNPILKKNFGWLGFGRREDALKDYEKIKSSSDKEKDLILFINKYPELGFDENKIIGLFDRKPWFTIDKIIFDSIMGLNGGMKKFDKKKDDKFLSASERRSLIVSPETERLMHESHKNAIFEKMKSEYMKMFDELSNSKEYKSALENFKEMLENDTILERVAEGKPLSQERADKFKWWVKKYKIKTSDKGKPKGNREIADELILHVLTPEYFKIKDSKDVFGAYKATDYFGKPYYADLVKKAEELKNKIETSDSELGRKIRKIKLDSKRDEKNKDYLLTYGKYMKKEDRDELIRDIEKEDKYSEGSSDDSGESSDELEGMGRDGYGLHAVIINKRMDFETAQKKAKEITGKKKIFHRVTKDSFRFRNIPKTKFEKKTYRSKKIDKDITLVFGKLKPEFRHLQGAGLFDWLKKGFEKVKGVFNRPEKLNNTSRKTLEKYGDKNINELTIIRTPINSLIKKVLQGLSKNFKYDDLFHLGLIADIEGGKKIILEKNEVINIDDKFKSNKDSVYMKVPYSGGLKLNDLVNNSIKLWSPEYKFYEYNYKDNNCQIFVRNLLKGSNLLNAELEKFIMQDVSDLLGSKTGKVATLITDIAGIFNKLTGGRIVGDDVLISKDDFLRSSNSVLEKLGEIKNIIESNPDFKSLQGYEITQRPISLRPEDLRIMSLPGSVSLPERVSRGSDSSAIPRQVERRGSEGIMGSVRNVLSPTSARRQQRALIEKGISQQQTAQALVVPRVNPLSMAQPEASIPRTTTPKKGIFTKIGEVLSPKKGLSRQQGIKNLTKTGEGKKKKTVTVKGKKNNK